MPQRSTPRLWARSLSASAWERARSSTLTDVLVLHEREQVRVLAAVGHGVETQQGCLVLRTEVAQADADRVVAARSAAHGDRPRRRAVALDGLVVSARPRLPEPHVVGVGVEHDDPQLGLHQQLLQQHAERVRLPRPGLAAQEGMAAKAGGVERERHAASDREFADVEPSRARTATARARPTPPPRSRVARSRRGTGRPCPSSTAPSPRATRIRTVPGRSSRRLTLLHAKRQHLAERISPPASIAT